MWNDADAYESVNVGWRYHFVNVSSSSFRHVTATYSQRLDVHLHPYTVDYLVPPTLKLHWTQSLPVAGIP